MPQPTNVGEPAYLTVAGAAAELQVSRTTIWRWIREGRLAAYRAGGRTVRIRRDDLRAALAPVPAAQGKEKMVMKGQPDLPVAEGDIWARYDPSRLRAALRKSAGTLATVDRQKLLKDVRKQRRQASEGRPA